MCAGACVQVHATAMTGDLAGAEAMAGPVAGAHTGGKPFTLLSKATHEQQVGAVWPQGQFCCSAGTADSGYGDGHDIVREAVQQT